MPLRKHLILPEASKSSLDFTTWRQGGGQSGYPERDRIAHAERLERRLEEVRATQLRIKEDRTAVALPTRYGTYIEFRGQVDKDLAVESLEDTRSGIRLLNVKKTTDAEGRLSQVATVYVPAGKEGRFAQKLEDYKSKETQKGKPLNDKLIRSIEDLKIANLHSLWVGKEELFPGERDDWYEVWIRTSRIDDKGQAECASFLLSLTERNVEAKAEFLLFYERAVVLVKANVDKLNELLNVFDCLAEIRPATTTAGFWTGQSSRDQKEWVEDLLNRLVVEQEHDVLVCMLDSGINNGHPLLSPLIPDDKCLTAIPEDGTFDPAPGHGTLMAGIIEYENLEEKLESALPVRVSNRLCSVKILPNRGENKPDTYGAITQQAVYRAELQFPEDRTLYSMAVTAKESTNGLPSSWSGAVDQLAYNDGGNTRLMVISCGNINCDPMNYEVWDSYPQGNSLRGVQDPAQSWNALSIGAYTEKMALGECPQYERVAEAGGISPFSTTSAIWPQNSLIKPEIVLEGGNLFRTNDRVIRYTPGEEVEALTTDSRFRFDKLFTTIGATSLATASASALASRLMQEYPNLWPESIRGLFVHSAEWTDTMIRQFPAQNKSELKYRMKHVGYGVPNEQRMLSSMDNALTMIAQSSLRPFYKKEGASYIGTKDMHLYSLPWPTDILRGLGETEVKIKVTLSYFIEPGPGEIGWTNKYRYQSCGLRFDINDVNESLDMFKLRVNKKMSEDNDQEKGSADSTRWKIGPNNRDVGSIHSDYIEDSAINLIDCRYVAVYPISGWWKLRTNLKQYDKDIRYSLLVSLETPSEEIDIYSVVSTQIENLVIIPIEIPIE